MPLNTLKELLVTQLDELYSGEQHALDVLPKLAQAASSTDLAKAFTSRIRTTKDHISRLDSIFDTLSFSPGPAETRGMKGLLADCMKLAENRRAEPHVRDAALIAVEQHVIHDEIVGYGCAKSWAASLGLDKATADLQKSLQEERQADAELSRIADKLNKEALAPLVT